MSSKSKGFFKLLMIGLIIISLIIVTGCVSEEKEKKEDNNGDGGDGGDGGNGNNTTNGNGPLVEFKSARVTPDNPNIGENVFFEVSTESENYIEELTCIICIKDGLCFSPPVTMKRTNPNIDDWTCDPWKIPDQAKGETLEYHFEGKDSLSNNLKSNSYSFQVQ
jgi:hypothetical protein